MSNFTAVMLAVGSFVIAVAAVALAASVLLGGRRRRAIEDSVDVKELS